MAGVREDHGPLISALSDQASAFSDLLLLLHKAGSDRRIGGDDGSGCGDFRQSDFGGDILLIQQQSIVIEADAAAGCDFRDGLHIVLTGVAAENSECHRAVHGPGVEETQAEAMSEEAGYGAFSGAGWPVYGNDHDCCCETGGDPVLAGP
jgi:hypothetical protein